MKWWSQLGRVAGVAVVLVCSICGFLATPDALAQTATANPASVILGTSISGLTQSPRGALNGPLQGSILERYLPPGLTNDVTYTQDIADAQMFGYVRTWSNRTPETAKVVILVFEFPTASQAQLFISKGDAKYANLSTSRGHPSALPMADSFSESRRVGPLVDQTNIVTFTKESFAVEMYSVSDAGVVTPAMMGTLALQQASQIPTTVPGTTTISSHARFSITERIVVGSIVALVLIILFLFALRRQRVAREHLAIEARALAKLERASSNSPLPARPYLDPRGTGVPSSRSPAATPSAESGAPPAPPRPAPPVRPTVRHDSPDTMPQPDDPRSSFWDS